MWACKDCGYRCDDYELETTYSENQEELDAYADGEPTCPSCSSTMHSYDPDWARDRIYDL